MENKGEINPFGDDNGDILDINEAFSEFVHLCANRGIHNERAYIGSITETATKHSRLLLETSC